MATVSLPPATIPTPPMLDPAVNRIDELVRLQKSAQRITSTLNIEEIIDRIVAEVSDSLRCVEINLISTLERESNGSLAGCPGMHPRTGRAIAWWSGKKAWSGHVAATRHMHYAPDVRHDPYYMACEPKTRSEVAIPLEVDGDWSVYSQPPIANSTLSPPAVAAFQGLCSHVAVAVQNARRLQRARTAAQQMTREAEEARSIQQALFRCSPLIPGFPLPGYRFPRAPWVATGTTTFRFPMAAGD